MVRLVKKIIRRFYRKFYYYERTLANNFIKDNHIQAIDSNLVDQIKASYPKEFTDRKYRIFKERLESDHEYGYAYVKDGLVLAYLWIARSHFYEGSSAYTDELAKDTIYLYDLYTFENYRQQGIMKKSIQSIFALWQEKDYQKIRTIVARDNKKSSSMMKEFGFLPLGQIKTKYLGNKKWTSYQKIR